MVYSFAATATGYVVGVAGAQKGSVGAVVGSFTNGRLTFGNSSGLTYRVP
jgi:hypothetical protein